jgi:hypothetical protein
VATLADEVVDSMYEVSPLNVAVMLWSPIVVGLQEQVATPLRTLVVPHALNVTPSSMNFTVPVVEEGPVTVASST